MIIKIEQPSDNAHAVISVKKLSAEIGFDSVQQSLIATAVSELSTNIIRYAEKGSIQIRHIQSGLKDGIQIVAEDEGPGIKNITRALTSQYSTGNSLGLGLSSVKRIMDEFEIETEPGSGTRISVRKWIQT